jgi:hypothetical protein
MRKWFAKDRRGLYSLGTVALLVVGVSVFGAKLLPRRSEGPVERTTIPWEVPQENADEPAAAE